MAEQTTQNQNEMTLLYNPAKSEINIFGGEFVSRYIDNCYILINGEKKDLQSKFERPKDVEKLEKLEIKLVEIETMDDMSSMFDGCSELISINAEKFNFSNVNNMTYIFQ